MSSSDEFKEWARSKGLSLPVNDDIRFNEWTQLAWDAWQASRESLVIDFSDCNVQHAGYNHVDCYAISDVSVILRRYGMKAKP